MSQRTKLACFGVMVALALAALVPSLALAGKPQPPPPPLTNPALAFVIGYPGQVYAMTADGKTVRQLSNLPGGSHHPTWSADGTKIAFMHETVISKSWDADDRMRHLYVMNADGSGVTLIKSFTEPGLHEPHRGFQLSWSPDGTMLAYTCLEHVRAAVLDLNTTETLELPLQVGETGQFTPDFGPDLEPDTPGFQGLIAYASAQADGVFIAVVAAEVTHDAAGELSITLGTPVLLDDPFLSTSQYDPRWSPDGGSLAFSDRNGKLLAVVDVAVEADGSPVFGLAEVTRDCGIWGGYYGFGLDRTWAPDGSYIATNEFTAILSAGRRGSALHDVFRIRPDGSGFTYLTPNGDKTSAGDASWNPNWVNDLD